ncbi:response regulator [Streptomyces sp. bgisy153]|uniref:response regulator n=1 Tax=Streptomyces sp. bgisy153 TaxID=3413793 RepID=UPI003D732214
MTWPQPQPLRVVIADDNPVVRAGLAALLTAHDDITVVAEAATGREACEVTAAHRPDVVLLDVRMPEVDGLSALPYLVDMAPVLMLTYSGEAETVQEALRAGAGGYLVHGEFTTDQLLTAVRDTVRGRPHLTPTATDALLTHLKAPGASATAHNSHEHPKKLRLITFNQLSQSQRPMAQSKPGGPGSAPDPLRARLSAREAEIMDLIASGMNNHEIAAACFIAEKTVKNHINRIFAKLHSASRAEATAKWLEAR